MNAAEKSFSEKRDLKEIKERIKTIEMLETKTVNANVDRDFNGKI